MPAHLNFQYMSCIWCVHGSPSLHRSRLVLVRLFPCFSSDRYTWQNNCPNYSKCSQLCHRDNYCNEGSISAADSKVLLQLCLIVLNCPLEDSPRAVFAVGWGSPRALPKGVLLTGFKRWHWGWPRRGFGGPGERNIRRHGWGLSTHRALPESPQRQEGFGRCSLLALLAAWAADAAPDGAKEQTQSHPLQNHIPALPSGAAELPAQQRLCCSWRISPVCVCLFVCLFTGSDPCRPSGMALLWQSLSRDTGHL